jgi:hypothetical protein
MCKVKADRYGYSETTNVHDETGSQPIVFLQRMKNINQHLPRLLKPTAQLSIKRMSDRLAAKSATQTTISKQSACCVF